MISLSNEVRNALDNRQPVVALESTIIAHGMPYPRNVETAILVEETIRKRGAIPATCAIIGGKLRAGLVPDELDLIGREGAAIPKASRRDLPYLVSKGLHGATTVASTMIIARLAGIRIFATGGIGGVHRGATTTMDISADLLLSAQAPKVSSISVLHSNISKPTEYQLSASKPAISPLSTRAGAALVLIIAWIPPRR